jgi:hypothetical protein
LLFAKAGSAATLPDQENYNSLGRCTAGRLYCSLRYTFDEFLSLADSFAAGVPPPTHV